MAKSGRDSKEAVVPGGRVDDVEKVFRKFDKNGDGKISLSELSTILNAVGPVTPPEEVNHIMLELDTNGDGFIDKKEFAAIYCPSSGGDSNADEKELLEAFNLYDIDKNGKITVSELKLVMESLGEKCSSKDCKRMIRKVDVDGDGCVNFEEFKKMMSKS
ncbi:unnamed protein product [Cuscuta epithymum]|uniref:EF-hand domain-containing protein n=1 Tax=Cuscuta epithymum TaxID=186058 RepID=A0AAV0E7U4_9ASTE|nr:unnamed protein product [Cuscuta epithymum]CAH9119108.1 unnamed protein product [Cuscuta epithymum]